MEIIKLGGFTGRLLHFFSRFTIAPGPTVVGTPLSSGVVWKSAGGTVHLYGASFTEAVGVLALGPLFWVDRV